MRQLADARRRLGPAEDALAVTQATAKQAEMAFDSANDSFTAAEAALDAAREERAQARTARYAARQAYERASVAADPLARRIRELSERLDRMSQLRGSRWHSDLITKHFPADFYTTCATVIPVLFLTLAVQRRAFGSLWRAYIRAFRRFDKILSGEEALEGASLWQRVRGILSRLAWAPLVVTSTAADNVCPVAIFPWGRGISPPRIANGPAGQASYR